ncbi:TPA: malate dehydrogenase [candidate division WOR-3 bacterium]|jgi:malate dehydrogenase (oxaloacetate-decarboxylating)(NADP+)|uniref:Malate dehydrogenase n=1 Tax=candidate division WOR-3 bacterium TaxID=2052148 RepID=A0A350HA34_UNCW3|nr:malate dehydrogenase [candidate division WOR-3 bacterium]
MKKELKSRILNYHSKPTGGKIEINVKKKCDTQSDLSLAYTPGVALPCIEIKNNPISSYRYTNRANLVGVISNGTAVLGLGDIGAEASKPVMEGKSVLFKKFAGIDAFDIEVNEKNPDKFIDIVASLEPTFGGINLEDIKGPECFYIEEMLIKRMNIPVFHDDQHGTSVIATAGLLNACEITGKDISSLKIVVSGAGAAALPTLNMFVKAGADIKKINVFDKSGHIHAKRGDLNKYNSKYAKGKIETNIEEAIRGADLFLGLSVKGVLTEKMLENMARNPIIFALANPDPEVDYKTARRKRPDAIICTGRSDYPNQINNVLGFPFIFRGVLDCNASRITENMKFAASKALSDLAKRSVPDYIKKIYGSDMKFSKDYIIPKPFDRRVFLEESLAVLKQAVADKVNRVNIDPKEYEKRLRREK